MSIARPKQNVSVSAAAQVDSEDYMVPRIIELFGLPLHTRQGHLDQAYLIQSALLLIMLLAL